jgi:(p)ppGpp synthase/HD superfamily hydrolase
MREATRRGEADAPMIEHALLVDVLIDTSVTAEQVRADFPRSLVARTADH